MITRALLILLALAVAGLLWFRGAANSAAARAARAEQSAAAAQSEIDSLRRQIADERARAQRLNEIAQQYETERANAQAEADRIIADLRSGNLRLHQRWQACTATGELSAAAARSGIADAGADDRAESASRIVRAAAECDAQVRGLQAVIRADRERVSPEMGQEN